MSYRTISTIFLSIAILAAAISAGVVYFKRETIAVARAEAAQAKADAAASAARQAEKEESAKQAEERAAVANREAKKIEAANLDKEKQNLELADSTAEKNLEAKRAEAQAAEAEAAKARDLKEAEKLKLKVAREESEKERLSLAKQQAAKEEADSKLALEKQKSDKVIAEAKLLELRQIDFQNMERELAEWKLSLEERERALEPEKTIADLSWAGGKEDTVMDADGNLRKQVKEVYDPEKDMTLPASSRKLARAEREMREQSAAEASLTRERIIASLEKLYVEALKDNRTIEAQHIKESILTMYPDWKFGEANP